MLGAGVAGLRLGILTDTERAGVDADVLTLYDAAVSELRDLGAIIEPFTTPLSFEQMRDGTGRIIGCEGYYHHMDDNDLYEEQPLGVFERDELLPGRSSDSETYSTVALKN